MRGSWFLLSTIVCWSSFALGSRPNIVLLLADDLGFSDLGSYGSEVHTPNLDELASQGVRFSNYHTAASCAPTRAMLMSGVDSHRAGVANMPESLTSDMRGKPGYAGTLSKNVVTVATLLLEAGYHTYMTGKWHLGKSPDLLPSSRGFERALTMADTGADNWEQKPYIPIYTRANWFEDGIETTLPEDFYSSEYFIDKTIEYIGSNLDDGKPFFSYVAFQAVHIPVQAPREYTEKYLGQYDIGWNQLRQERYQGAVKSGVVGDGVELAEMPTTLDWGSLSDDEKRYRSKAMAVYAGMIDAMDVQIGRLIDYLKLTDQFDNTIFIFISDNGAEPSNPIQSGSSLGDGFFKYWMSSNNYNTEYETLGEKGSYSVIGPSFASAAASPFAWYKFFAGEGGMRVPMIISGTDSPLKSGVTDAFSFVTDIVPTILQLAEVDDPQGRFRGETVERFTGHSLVPLLNQTALSVYREDEPIGYELGGNAALFKGKYKILKNRGPIGDGAWHLYNLTDDPGETEDLKTDESEKFEAMMADYRQYVDDFNVVPVPDDYDQRRQVLFYGIKNRMPGIVPILMVFSALIISVIGYRRFSAR